MSNSDNNEDGGPLSDAEDSVPRDPIWLRCAKFLSIIVVAGVLLGALFAFSIYVDAIVGVFTSRTNNSLNRSATEVSHDNPHVFFLRFIVGACIGGAMGLIYVIRCLIKRVDP